MSAVEGSFFSRNSFEDFPSNDDIVRMFLRKQEGEFWQELFANIKTDFAYHSFFPFLYSRRGVLWQSFRKYFPALAQYDLETVREILFGPLHSPLLRRIDWMHSSLLLDLERAVPTQRRISLCAQLFSEEDFAGNLYRFGVDIFHPEQGIFFTNAQWMAIVRVRAKINFSSCMHGIDLPRNCRLALAKEFADRNPIGNFNIFDLTDRDMLEVAEECVKKSSYKLFRKCLFGCDDLFRDSVTLLFLKGCDPKDVWLIFDDLSEAGKRRAAFLLIKYERFDVFFRLCRLLSFLPRDDRREIMRRIPTDVLDRFLADRASLPQLKFFDFLDDPRFFHLFFENFHPFFLEFLHETAFLPDETLLLHGLAHKFPAAFSWLPAYLAGITDVCLKKKIIRELLVTILSLLHSQKEEGLLWFEKERILEGLFALRAPLLRETVLNHLDAFTPGKRAQFQRIPPFKIESMRKWGVLLRTLCAHFNSLPDCTRLNRDLLPVIRDVKKFRVLLQTFSLLMKVYSFQEALVKLFRFSKVDFFKELQSLQFLLSFRHRRFRVKSFYTEAITLLTKTLQMQNVPHFGERFAATFGSSRNPSAILSYGARVCHDPAVLGDLRRYVLSVFAGTFQRDRYCDNAHLQKMPARVLALWKMSLPVSRAEGYVRDTDDPYHLLLSGTELLTCQSVHGDFHYNKGLVGTLLHGQTKMIVLTVNGVIRARSNLRLLLNENDEPVLYLDQCYGHPRYERELWKHALLKAKIMRLPLTTADGPDVPYGPIRSLGGGASWEYCDAHRKAVQKGEFTIDHPVRVENLGDVPHLAL